MIELDNPFWRFSLAVYAAPGVQAECLAAQDEHGADVNVLLYCLWLAAAERRALDADAMRAVLAAVEAWGRSVVLPLRAIRRGMKPMPEMEHVDVQALRQGVAAIELRAEQIEQAFLFALPRGRCPQRAEAPLAGLLQRNGAVYFATLTRGEERGPPLLQQLVQAAVQFSDPPSSTPKTP